MADGIKDKVAIIGMGCTTFGERWDMGPSALMVEAFMEAIQDAGIEKKDIDAGWLGTCYEEVSIGKSAIPLSVTLKLPCLRIPAMGVFRRTTHNRGQHSGLHSPTLPHRGRSP
jgi:acetyl-CoA C-acetyltransferase